MQYELRNMNMWYLLNFYYPFYHIIWLTIIQIYYIEDNIYWSLKLYLTIFVDKIIIFLELYNSILYISRINIYIYI